MIIVIISRFESNINMRCSVSGVSIFNEDMMHVHHVCQGSTRGGERGGSRGIIVLGRIRHVQEDNQIFSRISQIFSSKQNIIQDLYSVIK